VQTRLPPPPNGGPLPTPDGRPPPPAGGSVGSATFGVVIAVLALIFASVAVVFGGDGRPPSS
jgi:hypothetical protein